ncbi:hypothetical protein B9Z55_007724 [Caenorhabditis nigoni]|nr:hypothetical protein B9Z55_007724 [Caenorhabditis nigoni]
MASNEEGCVVQEPESTAVLENEQFLQKVADKINKENQKKFDELSNRLQSIETLLQKSKEVPEKNPIAETIVPHNVSSVQVVFFETLAVLDYNQRAFKNHKEVPTEACFQKRLKLSAKRMSVNRFEDDLGIYVLREPIAPSEKWSIRTYLEFKVVGPNQNDVIRTWQSCIDTKDPYGFYDFLDWKHMETWFLVDGSLTVEVKVKINEIIGLEKPKIRKFDESQRDVSDVILVVRGTKFYVSKMFLASQSSVFKTLLFGSFSESKQSEVKLNGIDPDDFHYFLEVLYGESAIDESNVEDVAFLADMYDAPTAIRKCEEFLLKESKKTVEKKLEIATQYNIENLKETCRSQIAAALVPKRKKVTKKNPLRKLLCF